MKKLLVVAAFLAASSTAFGQLNASFAKDTVTLTRYENGDFLYLKDIGISINSLNAAAAANTLNLSALPGAPASVFELTTPTLSPTIGTATMYVPFKVKAGKNASSPIHIGLQLEYSDGRNTIDDTVIIKVVNAPVATAKAESEDDASFHSKLTLLNGYNFDFNGKLNSNYVGVFNVYDPARDRGKRDSDCKLLGMKLIGKDKPRWKYGINAGIMKINYGLGGDQDSSTYHRVENTKINALDSIVAGGKYLRQYNKYTTSYATSVWSFYAQPLITLNPAGISTSKTKVYAHLHTELFVSKFTRKSKRENVEQDTAVFPNPVPSSLNYISVKTNAETVTSTTDYHGYLGAGLTFDISLTKNSSLFLQPTFGFTTNKPGVASSANYKRDEDYEVKDWNKFYMIRASFNQRLSDATQLVVSQDIRGLFPKYSPLYATYVGLNIKVDELLKLIKG